MSETREVWVGLFFHCPWCGSENKQDFKEVDWAVRHFTGRDTVSVVVKMKCLTCGREVHSENNFS